MTTTNVVAKRWRGGWELHIDGGGVTQSHTLEDAEPMVRDYLGLEGRDAGTIVIVLTDAVELDDGAQGSSDQLARLLSWADGVDPDHLVVEHTDDLAAVGAAHDEAARRLEDLDRAVARARRRGRSWADIAQRTTMSADAAEQRWGTDRASDLQG